MIMRNSAPLSLRYTNQTEEYRQTEEVRDRGVQTDRQCEAEEYRQTV